MARHRAPSQRRAQPWPVPPWLLLTLLALASVWGARELTRHAEHRGVGVVDTSRFKLHERSSYTSAAWRDRVARVLARTGGALPADEPQAIQDLCDELAGLSFVAEVGRPEVIWPDGLSIPLRYRQPVACLRVGDAFVPVDERGRILLGRSVVPLEAYGAWLPVVGRHERALELARPGDVLSEARHLQGFAVAASMWEFLAPEDVASLGRIVIDAAREYAPDGLPGGVVIDLEERRRILFGRAPALPGSAPLEGGAGELPLPDKWANVAAAARALRAGQDWVLFDARWDVPEVILRGSEFDLTLAAYASGG